VRYPDTEEAGMIQFTEDMTLSFYLPVPLNAGCSLTVELPSHYNVDTIDYVGSFQVFGYYREYTVDESTMTVD
jgi:hypothetical protein